MIGPGCAARGVPGLTANASSGLTPGRLPSRSVNTVVHGERDWTSGTSEPTSIVSPPPYGGPTRRPGRRLSRLGPAPAHRAYGRASIAGRGIARCRRPPHRSRCLTNADPPRRRRRSPRGCRTAPRPRSTCSRTVDLDGPTWHPFPAAKLGRVWPRRQAQETSIHRWDAEHATAATPARSGLASDGIDEFLDLIVAPSRDRANRSACRPAACTSTAPTRTANGWCHSTTARARAGARQGRRRAAWSGRGAAAAPVEPRHRPRRRARARSATSVCSTRWLALSSR